jgi:hypothetical protein
MTRSMHVAVWLLVAMGLVLAVVFTPLMAAYIFAGGALAIVAVLLGIRIARAVGDWRLEHGWGFGRRGPRLPG